MLVSTIAEIDNATQTILKEASQNASSLSPSSSNLIPDDIEKSIPSDEIFVESPQTLEQTITEQEEETDCDEKAVTEPLSQDSAEEWVHFLLGVYIVWGSGVLGLTLKCNCISFFPIISQGHLGIFFLLLYLETTM